MLPSVISLPLELLLDVLDLILFCISLVFLHILHIIKPLLEFLHNFIYLFYFTNSLFSCVNLMLNSPVTLPSFSFEKFYLVPLQMSVLLFFYKVLLYFQCLLLRPLALIFNLVL